MTGLLTFHWADDYGAMLQAFALKRYLEQMGEQVEVIPYAPVKLTGRYWWCPLYASVQNGKVQYWRGGFDWRINRSLGIDFFRKKQAMKTFRRHYLTAGRPKRHVKDLTLKPYSCVVIGSDQVWNPEITVGLDDAYIGNIRGREACRLIAYAASFGGDSLPEADAARFSKAVRKNFAAVSVREQSAIPFAAGILGKEVTDVLDPVLLLKRKTWETIARRPSASGYVLVYRTEYNQALVEYAGRLAGRYHKRLLQINAPAKGEVGLTEFCGRGPAEFVGYIQNASCIVTNSFHGTAFAILFEKPFLTFRHSSKNTRLSDLLEKLGLSARLRDENETLYTEDMWSEIDWNAVRGRLETERAQSGSFLYHGIKR